MKRELLTATDIRQTNKLNVLQCLSKHGVLTIPNLVTLCGTTIVTMGKVVKELMEQGAISAVPNELSRVGRRGLAYALNVEFGYFLCIDVTHECNIIAHVYDVHYKRVSEIDQAIEVDLFEESLNRLFSRLKQGLKNKNLLGIGISTPGIYLSDRDIILSELYGWCRSVRLKQTTAQYFSCDNIIIGQDVTFAAMAESERLSGNDDESVYYFFAGDGVGGAFVKGGVPHIGTDNIAGDIGQTLLQDNGQMVRLEQYCKQNILSNDIDKLSYLSLYPLYVSIFNVLWLLNPDFLIIGSLDNKLSETLAIGANNFLRDNQIENIKLTTRIQAGEIEHASLIGLAQELMLNFFKTL